MTLTATDEFCGAGGSSLGAQWAGIEPRLGLNHSPKACEVYGRNHRSAQVDCADISQADPRRYPRTDILLASPECTNHTSSKGVSRKAQDHTLFDSPDLLAERSRATMWDVHRFVEHHRYDAVIVENVVEASRWTYWRSWWQAWEDGGYDAQVLSLNSAHTGAVPQWRDRIYVVAVRKGIKRPDLSVRPPSWCERCELVVPGIQSFKRPSASIGRWRQQYEYRCGTCAGVVIPPAPAVHPHIEWSIPGQRIADRARPLAEKTMARLERAIAIHGPALVAAAGNTYERPGYTRAWPLDGPAPVQTTTAQHAVVVPYRRNASGNPTDGPAPTLTAESVANGLSLLFAPQSGGEGKLTSDPAPAITTKVPPLLVSYYRNGSATPVTGPASVVTTRDRHALVEPAVRVEDCTFRMVQPIESGRFMAFPDSYVVDGTKGEQQKMYGNAVTPPAMQLAASRVVEALAA